MKRIGKGAPIKIKNLFEVYKKRFRAPQSSVVNTAIEVIKDLTSITLTPDVLNYTPQSRILRISARGAVKSEIFLHREEILTHIQGRLGPQSAPKAIL